MAKKGSITKKNTDSELDALPPIPESKVEIRPKKRRLGRRRIILVVIVVVSVILGAGIWMLIKDKAELTHDEMVVRISRELQITGDANPALLTVEDETRVNQPFLDEAKNGDKVLLYYKAKKSVLFRPTEDRIVRSGTFTPPDAKVFVRKGTLDDGRVAAVKTKLKDITTVNIVSQDNGIKQDYSRTVVVDITDRYPEQAAEVARTLGGEVVRLPKGETIPDADMLIIVGNQ